MNKENMEKLKNAEFEIKDIMIDKNLNGHTHIVGFEIHGEVALIIDIQNKNNSNENFLRDLFLHEYEIYLKNEESKDKYSIKIGDIV